MIGDRLQAACAEHEAAVSDLDRPGIDTTEEQVSKADRLYARVLESRATKIEHVHMKLTAACRHYAGGDIPADDVSRLASEFEQFLPRSLAA